MRGLRQCATPKFPTESFLRECTPGYYNNEGGKVIRSHLGEMYGPGFYAFEELLRVWRDKGDMAGLVLGD